MLKEQGPLDAKTLAKHCKTTTMAVRLHLYDLRDQKLVTYIEEPRAVGRPPKMWRLTPAADEFFPNGHSDLVVNLIDHIRTTFGTQGIDRILATRARQQIANYSREISPDAPLIDRVAALARIRTAEGYMAEARNGADGGPAAACLLIENHCPICSAAAACLGFCATELEVFQSVLGSDVTVQRTEHIQEGARRCAYRIKPRNPA